MVKNTLQIVNERREVKVKKVKGERERYTQLNAEFQRIAKRDKKAFLNEQCKEIEENNGMGKARDLFKKIRDFKGIFNARMGTIKDRKSKDLTEVQDIKRRRQEYTEELYKKGRNGPDNIDGVVTHLEIGILQCEVKWALGSITINKASKGFQLSYFKSGDDAVKVLSSICQQICKFSSDHRTGKGQFSFQSQRKEIPKNVQTPIQLCLFHTIAR